MGGVGLAMYGSSLPPCVSAPSSWKPPRQGDGTAPLGWPECLIKRQPSLEETCPPKHGFPNTGQSYTSDPDLLVVQACVRYCRCRDWTL